MADFQTLSDCIRYYQNYHLTKHKYFNRANALMFFDAYSLYELKRYHVKKYFNVRSLVVSNATINREISFARAAINCVNRDFELDIKNCFCDIKFVERDYIPRFLTLDQFYILLEQCKKQGYDDLHDFVALLAMTGCRPVELLNLKWENVFLDRNFFIVRNCWSKSKRTMYKYLNDTALNILKRRYSCRLGCWVFTNHKTNENIKSYSKVFKKVRANLDFDCTFYDLRHSYASWLVQGSVSIYMVKDLLGHRDISSTMRYAHLDYDNYLNALKVIG